MRPALLAAGPPCTAVYRMFATITIVVAAALAANTAYADDTIVGFEHRHEAEQFLADLKARLARFGLALHPDKTRLIEFGRCVPRRASQQPEQHQHRWKTAPGNSTTIERVLDVLESRHVEFIDGGVRVTKKPRR